MSAEQETPELHADLPDILRLVAELATIPAMGRRGRQILLQLHAAGADIERMDGLVIEGEVYAATWRQEWAPCTCADGIHKFDQHDVSRGRGYWCSKSDAELMVTRQKAARAKWEPHTAEPHLVTHLVATTTTEAVR